MITHKKIVNSSDEENKDLGFGSVVARESRQRLLNRDGTFNVARKNLNLWTSVNFYHSLLVMPWLGFLAIVAIFYVFINSMFALAYIACGIESLAVPANSLVKNSFLQGFFFSVQTFATIGYGHVNPVGLMANIIVTIESIISLLSFALVTGLVFARFSRPTAKILFSEKAIIAPYRGISAFEFRITNLRKNQIIELEAKVLFARFEDVDGRPLRRFYTLPLERNKVTFFPLSWTIVHPIDQESPLHNLTPQNFIDTDAEFLILLTGIDETFSQTVHARSSYKADEIVWNAKFKDIFNYPKANEPLTIDVDKLHSIERQDTLERV
jgi:inward rectifier potassium channel